MTIIRSSRPEANFTIVRNQIFDEGLSAEALGVLCYLLSRPDNWQISKKELGNRFSMGRDKTNRLIKELCEARYMEARQPRYADGKAAPVVYQCFDEKQPGEPVHVKSAPFSGNPSTEKPYTANPYQTSTDNKLRTELNKGSDMFSVLDLEQQAFDCFADVAKSHDLPVPQMLNETRRAHIRQRLRDCGGLEGWRAAVDKVAASPYLTGKVKDWKADLDFVLNPTRFAKIMEGGYDGRIDPTQHNGHCRQTARREAIDQASRELAAEFG